MHRFEKSGRWNGWVVMLLGVAAAMGCFNSVLQLSRYGTIIGDGLSTGHWMKISLWLGLLILWALILGLVAGFFMAKHWYGAGADERSMAPSD